MQGSDWEYVGAALEVTIRMTEYSVRGITRDGEVLPEEVTTHRPEHFIIERMVRDAQDLERLRALLGKRGRDVEGLRIHVTYSDGESQDEHVMHFSSECAVPRGPG